MENILVLYNSLILDDKIPKRIGTNFPEKRQKLIYQYLFENRYHLIKTSSQFCLEDLLKLNIHSKEYIYFIKNIYKNWCIYKDTDFINDSNGIIPYHFYRHLEFQSINKLPLYKQIGYYADDVTTPIYEDTFINALDSANNGYQAIEYLDKYMIIYCLNTYPGHHAFRSGYGGYCFLNNAAIVASKYINKFPDKKVTILDLDYHHGNGTQEIFWNNNKILTISLHIDPRIDYPSFSGFNDETNKGLNMNIELKPGINATEYNNILQNIIKKKIQEFNSNLLVIAFGGDTIKDDPDVSNLGGFNIKLKDYIKFGNTIKKFKYDNIIITQEGGYKMDKIHLIVNNFLLGLI